MSLVPVLSLDKYRDVVGDKAIDKIYDEASVLSEKTLVHINSTYQGGGVAEILNSLIILLNDAGIKTDWRILHGDLDFFTVTKKFHNALQGEKINFTEKKRELYYINNVNNAIFTHINQDMVIVHDPQPLPIITCYQRKQPWVWRCHIDISQPNQEVWEYLRSFILNYNGMIISMEQFRQKNIPSDNTPQHIIPPSINPLNIKNKDIPESTISKYLGKHGIKEDKPIVSQISRFDKWKDPLGVIKIFEHVSKKVDCQLLLVGSMATDDPEGQEMVEEIEKKVADIEDVHVVIDAPDIVTNAIQRASSVVLQKSLKEGFALTVSESLYKETPVVASNIGGIPSQVLDGENGFLLKPKDYEGFAEKIVWLLKHPEQAKEMGKKGKEHIKNNFLITRHVNDYVQLAKNFLIKK
jgi:trehalose synthase